jgi:hypothetical protein
MSGGVAGVMAMGVFRFGVFSRVAALFLVGAGPCLADDTLDTWRARAEQGDARAQFNLGLMYDTGEGVPQDDAEAVRWYRLAADQGDATAQYNLGLMYANGQGVPQDYVAAHMWLNLAAAQGNANASESRDIVANRMTPEQIAEAQRLAREWTPAAN